MLLFSSKKEEDIFRAFSHRKLYRFSHNWCNMPETNLSIMSHLILVKRAWSYLLRIGRNEFSKKSAIKFPILGHLPSRHDILMIVPPKHTRSRPMETRHPNLSRDTKFEEIQAPKDLQTVNLKWG